MIGITMNSQHHPYPELRDEWDGLLEAVREIAEGRLVGDAALVARGDLDRAEAQRRARVAEALDKLWTRAVAGTPIPPASEWLVKLGATRDEMIADLRGIEERLVDKPGRRRDLVDALIWHLLPMLPGYGSHIEEAAPLAAALHEIAKRAALAA